MALDDDIRLLSGVALFQSLAEEHLRLLAFGAEKASLRAGETLYQAGEPALSAYIVMSTLRAMIAPTRRLSSAMAAVESRVMVIERKSFRRILEEYPELPELIHQRLAREFQAMVEQLDRLSAKLGK